MNTLVWVFAVVLTVVGATVGSVRRVTQGNEALVERLGRYHRKLSPGLNFGVIPIIDEVVVEATTRERKLDIEPSEVITKDNVTLTINALIFWKIIDLYSAYYEIEDVESALRYLAITTLRSKIGQLALQETYSSGDGSPETSGSKSSKKNSEKESPDSGVIGEVEARLNKVEPDRELSSREKINKELLENLDDATEPWGVKVTRVEIEDIKLPEALRRALERERAAQSERKAAVEIAEGQKQAAIAEADGQRQAQIKQAEGIAEAVKQISEAMPKASAQDILRYLVMQRYVDANLQLGESANSKVIFMNPRDITENIDALLRDRLVQYPNPLAPPSSNPEGTNSSDQGGIG